jgi:hypothetical protein
MRHASEWLQSALSQVAANTPPASPLLPPAPPLAPVQNSASAAAKTAPNGLYFPSSASIPPVSIMNAEPTGPQQQAAPADASAKPSAAAAARKPTPSTQQPKRPTSLAAPGRPAGEPAPDP